MQHHCPIEYNIDNNYCHREPSQMFAGAGAE